eukprot:TRINITY_DN110704_c0_g1_i1.p1 TRINITY_DN110704_c0_g1~~TRINITY_DN110704_c0_g1_i1.p1  ORF type:complete len:371 (-),score=67.27 TRINITY_DN110704_c0_g1_i1:29-1141(-)
MADRKQLGLGILGAARNVPFSVLQPLRSNPDLAARLRIVGLASLEKAEAEAACKDWGIGKAYASFEELLQDPAVHAVYNVLPLSVRCEWTVKAILAGKHVLSETPSVSRAHEAVVTQRCAEDHGRVLLEGTHPTCHPVTKRVRQMIMEGKIGTLEHIDLDMPVGHSLQGKMVCSKTGALMGVGVHGVAIIRALAGEEPTVVSATAQTSAENPGVDTAMSCNLRFPSGAIAHVGCSIIPTLAKAPTKFTISGSDGIIRVQEWFTGQGKSSNEIALEQFAESGEQWVERVDNPVERDTFYFQLMGFVEEVYEQERGQAANIGMPWAYTNKGPVDTVRNMAVIDSIYRKAGMKARESASLPPEPYDHIGRSKL